MNITYATQTLDANSLALGSIFLAGPTPRSTEVISWRPEAIEAFRSAGYGGTLLVPEDESGECKNDYTEQVEWEEATLIQANCIMFWVPRKLDTMPALTTNVEFGAWMRSGKCVFGAPSDAEKVKYLQYYAKKLNIPAFDNLMDTIMAAIKMDVRKMASKPKFICKDCGCFLYSNQDHKEFCVLSDNLFFNQDKSK